jgi:hypothetical protein
LDRENEIGGEEMKKKKATKKKFTKKDIKEMKQYLEIMGTMEKSFKKLFYALLG